MNEVVVTLTPFEVELAGFVATRRVVYNLENKAKPKWGQRAEFGAFDSHFPGCLGEIATAKYLDRYWTGGGNIGDYGLPDVSDCIQVRARIDLEHRLLLHPEDNDVEPFVLATVLRKCLPRVQLSGWLRALDGKSRIHWKEHTGRPAFFVPETELLPMERLKL